MMMMIMNGISLSTANNALVLVCLFALLFQSGESWRSSLAPPPSTVRQWHHTVSTLYHHHHHISEEHGVSPPLNKADDRLLSSSISSLPSRRELFSKIIAKTAAASSLVTAVLSSSSMSATAATAAANVVITAAVCDSSVSVWQLPAVAATIATATDKRGGMDRLVYLLGTAHISELSAQLAGQLVRDTHPNAVFVELDLKRIGGLGKGSGSSSSSSRLVIPTISYNPTTPSASAAVASTTVMTAPEDGLVAETTAVAVATPESPPESPPPPPLPPSPQPQPRGGGGGFFRQGFLNMGAAAVGNAIRSMYKSLDDAGFKPGDEFAMAIQAGRDINADIVLGDQDVQITLRRLTQALAVTDLNKLMDPNSDLERNMRQLIGGSSGGSGRGDELALPGMTSTTADGKTLTTTNAEFKRDLSAYIEVIKTRDSVRQIMRQLNEVAPALVQVMLTERDAYMAAGLDTLNQYEVITAVVGVAHQDGIEANLRQRGWKQVALKCPRR